MVRFCASRLCSSVTFRTDAVWSSVINRQWRNPTSSCNTADLGTSYSDLATARYATASLLVQYFLDCQLCVYFKGFIGQKSTPQPKINSYRTKKVSGLALAKLAFRSRISCYNLLKLTLPLAVPATGCCSTLCSRAIANTNRQLSPQIYLHPQPAATGSSRSFELNQHQLLSAH